MNAWVRLKPHTHTKCGLRFPPQYHISYKWGYYIAPRYVPHFLHMGSLHSPMICKCLLKVLCPVSRPIMTLVCVLLKDSSRAPIARSGPEINSEACLCVLQGPRHNTLPIMSFTLKLNQFFSRTLSKHETHICADETQEWK